MMKRLLNVAAGIALMATGSSYGAPPAAVNLHGQLIGSSGDAVTGDRAYQVTFYDAETGGNVLGTALTGTVSVSDSGLFNLSVTPPADILTAGEVWYALGVDTDVPADNDASDDLFPTRIRIYSVPFALQAQEVVGVAADRVGSGMVDDTEFDALDGVTGNLQQQIDGVDTAGIAQNTADIAQNSTDIATNATNIAANTTALADKANSADVYTQTAADTAFVDAAGDTMSGALGVDTITEATADAGVTAEGLMLKDSYLGLPQISTPGDTANKLYNVAGALFFGGTQLGLSSLDKDGINNAGTLGFDWADGEIADTLTIQGGSVNDDSFSAISDLTAESAIGTGSGQVAAGNHSHLLSALGGSVTDGQVPDALTIQGGSVNNDSFSALGDLMAETAIGTASGQVAAGDHAHAFSAITGTVTDAQVPDTITISGVDAADDSSAAPAMAYASDPDTGIHRPGADQLAMVTNGAARFTVDDVEVNLSGNIMEIATGSAPGVTANKLYNSSGNLFWNGTQLDAGGGGTAVRYLDALMPDDTDGPALLGPLDSTAGNSGYLISISDTGNTLYTGFIPEPVTVVIERMWIMYTGSFSGGSTTTLDIDLDVRRNSDGAVQHALAGALNPVLGAQGVWQEITLPVAEADRTSEPSEYIAVTSFTTTDHSSGSIGVFIRAQISDQ